MAWHLTLDADLLDDAGMLFLALPVSERWTAGAHDVSAPAPLDR